MRTAELRSPVAKSGHLYSFVQSEGSISEGTLSHDYDYLQQLKGQYNSNLDIDPEDHRRPKKPKDMISWILIGINLSEPTKLSSLKAKTTNFPFSCPPHSTLNSTRYSHHRLSILT